MITYGSVCSGVDPAGKKLAQELGWCCAWHAEIEPFPSAVLAHHYPETPNHGDFTSIGPEHGPVDLLLGGTPCQSFSVAGKRGGLDDPRGNLAIEFVRLARRVGARWILWENVPGVLSSNGGRDFGTFLWALADGGYGFSYRVLDAQWFGVAQRRRRVFVVGYLGDWRRAAAVLFERESLSGNPAPRREAGKAVAALTARGVGTCGADDNQAQAGHLIHCPSVSVTLTRSGSSSLDPEMEPIIAQFPIGVITNDSSPVSTDGSFCPTLRVGTGLEINSAPAVAFQETQTGCREYELAGTLRANGPGHDPVGTCIRQGMAVRRLTPRECERLQGFADDWTLVPYRGKPAADGPRYKAIGNSWAVPVILWICRRIAQADRLEVPA